MRSGTVEPRRLDCLTRRPPKPLPADKRKRRTADGGSGLGTSAQYWDKRSGQIRSESSDKLGIKATGVVLSLRTYILSLVWR